MMNNDLKRFTACFSGGRPKSLYPMYAYAQSRVIDYTRMIQNIYEYIKKLYIEKHIYRFISGGAQGFDQLAFKAVAMLKNEYPEVQNIVCIPFKNQDNKWMATGLFSREEYQRMLKTADEVRNCNPNIDPTIADFRVVTKALMFRNECMCNDSSVIIGQYPDDSWIDRNTKGGTANCLRYAKSKGLEMHVKDFRP